MTHETTMKTIPEFSTIQLLKDELAKLGYSHQTIVLGEDNYTQFTSPAGKVWFTSNTHINYPFVTSTARTISDKKHLAYQLAEQLGVTIPHSVLVDPAHLSETVCTNMLKRAPLIVKPDNASLSHGLTLNITDMSELQTAVQEAAEFSNDVLIQTQVSGQEIRFVVVDGTVRSALLRETPRITGDGSRTVGQLIAAENAKRQAISVPYLSYPLISSGDHDSAQIPVAGEIIELGKSTMIRGGASVYDVLRSIDPSYVTTAERLAGALGHGFVVVDIFIQDYRQPQTADNYAFIEFNMSPVLKLCYSCRDGQHYDALADLIPLIDNALHGRKQNEAS